MPFWRRKTSEREVDRELRAHLDLEAEEHRQSGMSEQDALSAAYRALGNQTLIRENVREVWSSMFWESIGQDLRFAFRSLLGTPVFTLVAVSSLALGLGANTAIFSFVNALLLKQLPVPEPSRLAELTAYEKGKLVSTAFSLPMLSRLDKDNPVFDGILARFPVRVSLADSNGAEPLKGEVVSGNYFKTLRIDPAVGRLLSEEDITAGTGDPVCVISYSLWQSRFAADPNIVSRKLLLNGHLYTVVGVTQKGFFGPQLHSRIDIQLPVSRTGDFMGGFLGGELWNSPSFTWLQPLARLKPGYTLAQAEAALGPIARAIAQQLAVADQPSQRRVSPRSYRLNRADQGVSAGSSYGDPVLILMAIVALVLLVACANLANLLLARATVRSKEFAVRLSLGASRARLIRQLLVESFLLSTVGGLVGLALAFWIVRSLLLFLNAGNSGGLHVALDPVVISFSVILALLTSLLFGLLPAWQSTRPDILPQLKDVPGKGSAIGGSLATRRFVIVFQIAISLAILFAAGLFTRTLTQLRSVDLGFDPARVLTLRTDPAMNGYPPPRVDAVFDEILSRLRTQPGIVAASLAVVSPLSGGMISLNFEVPGRVAQATDAQTNFNMVSPGYFKTLNQAILAGRDFQENDVKTSPQVAIVNELFAAQYMPGQNPIGRRIKMGGSVEIVGLVKNSRYQTLRQKPCPLIYLPTKQSRSSGYAVLVRTNGGTRSARALIARQIRAVDPHLPIFDFRELQEQVDSGISSERALGFLSTLFGILATILCSIGIYGLIAYAVSRRTREIGIRLAIGARKDDVARLFLRESVVLVATGVLIGTPLALASSRFLQSLLYGVAPFDPATLLLTISIFFAIGLFASLAPVRKATRIEPASALRYE